jgi:hypothetical protein
MILGRFLRYLRYYDLRFLFPIVVSAISLLPLIAALVTYFCLRFVYSVSYLVDIVYKDVFTPIRVLLYIQESAWALAEALPVVWSVRTVTLDMQGG